MMAATNPAGSEYNENAHGGGVSSFSMPEDVRKYGYMRKLKTNKKKFFVLRLNSFSTLSKATLSYYDNEKKFRQNPNPPGKMDKRTVLLTECFAVARKIDPKHKHVLGLYTKEDLLGLILDDEKQFLEWLQAIRFILYKTPEYQSRQLRDFSYIWQGNLVESTFSLSRGTYRICLLPTSLHLIRVDPSAEDPEHHIVPLHTIRRLGHNTAIFYLQLGRSSVLGEGDLGFLTEDIAISKHMHERVLHFMINKRKFNEEESLSHVSTVSSSNTTSLMTTSTANSSSPSSSSQNHRPRSSSTSVADFKSNPQGINVRNSVGGTSASTAANSHAPHLANNANNFRHYSMFDHGGGLTNIPHPYLFPHFPPQYGLTPMPMPCFHGRNGAPNITGNASSSSQSPTNSRERLHSGSWSRTASDCSNEDLSGSSSTATTPVGPPGAMYYDCIPACSQFFSSASAMMHPGHSFPMDLTKPNSSNSSLATEDQTDHGEHLLHSPPPSHMEPQTLEEDPGYGADLDMYVSHSTCIQSAPVQHALCSNCVHHLMMMQMVHQHQQQWHMINGHHPSRSASSTGSHNQSPVNSPKCVCTMTPIAANAAAGNHLMCHRPYLPTIPAGEPSDYVPMSPMNDDSITPSAAVSSKPTESTVKEEPEESSYLHMAPLSPNSKSNPMSTPTTTAKNPASASNSTEFHLDKVRSHVSSEDDSTTAQKSSITANVFANQNAVANAPHQDDSFFDGLTRAYSTGSKPQPLAPSIGARCANNTAASSQPQNKQDNSHLRTRAFSTGSHGMKFRAFRLNSRRKKQNQVNQNNSTPETDRLDNASASASSSSLAEENIGSQKSHKAASSPMLSSLAKPRVRSHTLGSKPSGQNQLQGNNGKQTSQPSHPTIFLPFLPIVCDSHALFAGKGQLNTCYPGQRPGHPIASSPPNASAIPPPISMPEEGDLMEIDYSAKNKERTQQRQSYSGQTNKSDDKIISEFEEQSLREGKKKDVQKERNSHSAQESHRKRSDSISTLANLFHHGTSSAAHEQSNRSTTHYHLVSSFKQSLSFHHPKTSKEPEQTHGHKAPDEEDEYMLLDPSTNSTSPCKTESIQSKHSNKSFVSSIGSVIQRKSNYGKQPVSIELDKSEVSQTLFHDLSGRNPAEPVPERNASSPPFRSAASHEMDEEESSYVMMAPENTTTGTGKSSSGAKKHKNSVLSLFSSMNKNSASGSKFKMIRNNSSSSSGHSNQNQRTNSSTSSKIVRRPGSSKSESSTTTELSPPIPSSLA